VILPKNNRKKPKKDKKLSKWDILVEPIHHENKKFLERGYNLKEYFNICKAIYDGYPNHSKYKQEVLKPEIEELERKVNKFYEKC
jgi:hypothetical protein